MPGSLLLTHAILTSGPLFLTHAILTSGPLLLTHAILTSGPLFLTHVTLFEEYPEEMKVNRPTNRNLKGSFRGLALF